MENNRRPPLSELTDDRLETTGKSQNFLKRLGEKWNTLSPEMKVYVIQLGLIAAVQAPDVLSTHMALQLNPVTRESLGIPDIFTNKTACWG